MGIHGCSDICINTPGSYKCQCSEGYTLAPDRMTCDSIGEPRSYAIVVSFPCLCVRFRKVEYFFKRICKKLYK